MLALTSADAHDRRGFEKRSLAAVICVGIDTAWGKINETGVLALDQSARILDAGMTGAGVNGRVDL
jgi:hypothetical protein